MDRTGKHDSRHQDHSSSYAGLYLAPPAHSSGQPPESLNSLVDDVLRDKRRALSEKIGLLKHHIASRWDLYRRNIEHIALQECIVCTTMDNLSLEWNYVSPKRQQGLEQEMHQLHEERRKERTRAWEDTQELEEKLLEAVHEYREARRNECVLEVEDG